MLIIEENDKELEIDPNHIAIKQLGVPDKLHNEVYIYE
jgi:hypothetical protein